MTQRYYPTARLPCWSRFNLRRGILFDYTPQEMVQNAFNMFIYKDASANYGHRNILKMANLIL